jgi:hypothetical protein
MEKKKLIRIEKRGNGCSGGYEYSQMNFTFVSSPAKERIQCAGLMTCRESLNKVACFSKNERIMAIYDPTKDVPVDFEKLRLLIVKTVKKDLADFKAKLFSGKALLNRYEEKAGWIPSKITTVKHPYYGNAWLLTGPKEWMSQPQLLSIATLFMRLMSIHGPLNMDSFQQAEDSLKVLYNNYTKNRNDVKESPSFEYCSDIEYYLKYIDDISLLMTNVEKVFEGTTLDKAWAYTEDNIDFGIQSGILTFFGETIPTYNKYVEIYKKNFIKLKFNGERSETT